MIAGAAAFTLLGGVAFAVSGGDPEPPPVAAPPVLPSVKPSKLTGTPVVPPPSALPDSSGSPSADPAESPSVGASADVSATPSAQSTGPTLTEIPEVCDLLGESTVKRLAPQGAAEPDSSRDGYGALRKGCQWNQKGYAMKNGYNQSRTIHVKVAVYPDSAQAAEDADFSWDSMRDFAGTTRPAPYNTVYGELQTITTLGGEAYGVYSMDKVRKSANAWLLLHIGNSVVEVRYFGTDNKGREILSNKNSRPVAEDILLKGMEEIAKEVVGNLVP
ncbi:hypothetical protein [Streptosporangium sp. KLBMP 9127]|nr:hypothetical protein [Streptosporangium sp. KLBMP 9127]